MPTGQQPIHSPRLRRRHILTGTAALAAILITTALAAIIPASATNDDFTVRLAPQHAPGICLSLETSHDVDGTPGTPVIQWNCNGKDGQRWNFDDQGNNTYLIRNHVGGQCLGISGTTTKPVAGSTTNPWVWQWIKCNGKPSQSWRLQPVDTVNGETMARIESVGRPGQCWDIKGRNTTGTTTDYNARGRVQIHTCKTGTTETERNQIFYLTTNPNGGGWDHWPTDPQDPEDPEDPEDPVCGQANRGNICPDPGDTHTLKVLVVAYDPWVTSAHDPNLSGRQRLSEYLQWPGSDVQAKTTDTIELFDRATNGQMRFEQVGDVVYLDKFPNKIHENFAYTVPEYLDVWRKVTKPYEHDAVNYNAIIDDPALRICDRVRSGEIDEVWVQNGPWFGFYESLLVSTDGYFLNSGPLNRDCGRPFVIMGPSMYSTVANDLHNFGHRVESAIKRVYLGWETETRTDAWNTFSFIDAKGRGTHDDHSYVGCGNIHFSPLGRDSADEYVFDFPRNRTVQSNCDQFLSYDGDITAATPAPVEINCEVWGCSTEGYYEWWFAHVPRYAGCGADGVLKDWWSYVADPDLVNNPYCGPLEGPATPCQVLSNGSFEAGYDHWHTGANPSWSTDATSGTRSLVAGPYTHLWQYVPMDAGATFELTGMTKTDGLAQVDQVIVLRFTDVAQRELASVVTRPAHADWRAFSLSAVAPTGTKFVQVEVVNGEHGFIKVDDLVLRSSECPLSPFSNDNGGQTTGPRVLDDEGSALVDAGHQHPHHGHPHHEHPHPHQPATAGS